MTSRYPLIVNPSTNQIQEIPFGDVLDLNGNYVTNINVVGPSTISNVSISSGIITSTTGIVTYYGDGRGLTNINPNIGINTSGGNVGYGISTLDFRGTGISTVIASSGIATIYIQKSATNNQVLIDSTEVSIYVGNSLPGTAQSASSWTIVRSLFSSVGIRTSQGYAYNVSWTNRTTSTYT